MPVVIEAEPTEANLLPACSAPGCRIVGRPGEVLCDAHHVEQRRLAAQRRLAQAAPAAAEVLADLVENGTTDDVRRKAAEAILDRTGLRPGMEITVTATSEGGNSPADVLRQRLELLRRRTLEAAESANLPTPFDGDAATIDAGDMS